MKSIAAIAVVAALCVGICTAAGSIDVVAVAPKSLYRLTPASVSITAVDSAERTPAVTVAAVWLSSAGGMMPRLLYQGVTDGAGRLTAEFLTPDLEPGAYNLNVDAVGLAETLTAAVDVCEMPLVLVETDKPIYKPGQTIKGRVLVLNNELRPSPGQVSVEIKDAKGIKVFRKSLTANTFGVAVFELDLATELNYGTWKITAESGSASGGIDVRVERYVLPRFEVKVDTPRDYYLVDEGVEGVIEAAYFFGKPVDGTAIVRASRYVGVWEEYASYQGTLSAGSAAFELPEVGYVSGTTGAGGAGSVQLDVTVRDTSGHEEKTSKLLKIVDTSVQHRLIALSRTITPGIPFDVLLVAETPDSSALTATASAVCEYHDLYWGLIGREEVDTGMFEGTRIVTFHAPKGAAWAVIGSTAQSQGASGTAELSIYAAYSPSDSFMHLARRGSGAVNVGDTVILDVVSTHNATVYYDVVANGRTLWSGYSLAPVITLQAVPQMVPGAKVVAYMINPNNEISADYVTFDVILQNSSSLEVRFDAEQVLPGAPVKVSVDAGTEAMVGVAIVDESVYALSAGRLNMQEVFEELERRFMEPQVETHEDPSPCGAYEVFKQAGMQILASNGIQVPRGGDLWSDWWRGGWAKLDGNAAPPAVNPAVGGGEGLAEVTRVRQFFPETWLWMPQLLTDVNGAATIELEAPDSITTWKLSAVATSQDGLGMAGSQLAVFQEFFGEPDLPYAVTRGEQFPVRVQVFNYLDQGQDVLVELTGGDWFRLLDPPSVNVHVEANSVAPASFLIEPLELGRHTIELTFRSLLRADAVRRELLVEPEGTRRELVENGIIKAGEEAAFGASIPESAVSGSGKVLLSVTPSMVAQSINGVGDLLGMPYGCGEQNMIFFAPDVEVLRYLDATGQLTPQIRAEAEHFITVGYQRQLTFRHQDGAFSAFGESDQSGSLWLTAFVLDSFSAAREIMFIDASVLAEAAAWIESYQRADGSWEPVGFVCHQEMIGGIQGNYALTAFVTIALSHYGDGSPQAVDTALEYLSANVSTVWDDSYGLAIAALALTRGAHPLAGTVLDRLLELAVSDSDGLYWEPHAVETTAYAALALMEAEMPQANEAVKWLSLQRNSLGGFGHTQDTVMALKALMTAASLQGRDVDMTVIATAIDPGGPADEQVLARFTVNEDNFDVLQVAELPAVPAVRITGAGNGQSRFQLARRFNVLTPGGGTGNDMSIEVHYDASHVEVDDIVNVDVTVRYYGGMDNTGMMIVDVGVPTGFEVQSATLEALVESGLISRYEIAGRKVIFYVDGLHGGETRSFQFQVKALMPVRAIIPDSSAYLYYQPEVKAQAAGGRITAGFDAPIEGDLNEDGCVDMLDFAALAAQWPASGDWPALARIAANWLVCR